MNQDHLKGSDITRNPIHSDKFLCKVYLKTRKQRDKAKETSIQQFDTGQLHYIGNACH